MFSVARVYPVPFDFLTPDLKKKKSLCTIATVKRPVCCMLAVNTPHKPPLLILNTNAQSSHLGKRNFIRLQGRV